MNTPRSETNRKGTFALGALIGGWFLLDACTIAPDFGQLDIYYFKDSGINFAQGLGLTTRFTYGNPTFSYEDYSQYPPIYPLTFGLFTKAAGVSARSNQIFNSFVALLCGVLGFLALRPVMARGLPSRFAPWLGPAVSGASIITGYYCLSYDRPDGLGVALGIVSLMLAIRGTTTRSALAAGAFCALTLFTSPFAGLWTALAATLGIAAKIGRTAQQTLRRAFLVVAGGCASGGGLLVSLRVLLPGWFRGFFGVATGANTHNETGGGYFLALLRGDIHTWWSGFDYSRPESLALLIKLCAVAAAMATVVTVALVRRRAVREALRLVPLLIVSPTCLVTAPYQSNYAAITAALLLAAWAGVESARPEGPQRPASTAILCAFLVNLLLTVPFQARELAIRSIAGESLPRALDYLQTNVERLKAGRGYVAVSPTNYILWRQAGLRPLINVYSGFRNPADRARLATLALSYPGSGNPLQPQTAEFVPLEEYRPVFLPQLPQSASIAGFTLSHSSQTWESALYERRSCEKCSARGQDMGVDEKVQPWNPHHQ